MMTQTEPAAPADHKPKPSAEQEYWATEMAKAYGGTARRKVRRRYARAQKKKVVVANRRRFRQWQSDRMVATTVGNQLRILAGEFGTPRQRARILVECAKIARENEVELDDMVASMREQLGMNPIAERPDRIDGAAGAHERAEALVAQLEG